MSKVPTTAAVIVCGPPKGCTCPAIAWTCRCKASKREEEIVKMPARNQLESEKLCQACGRGQQNRPMIFRGQPFCSENCRKQLVEREGKT